jgi:hypothetical protein
MFIVHIPMLNPLKDETLRHGRDWEKQPDRSRNPAVQN